MTKKKKIIIIICSVTLIAAIALAIVLPIALKKNDEIGYSYDNENKPIEYDGVSKMVFYKKFSDILKYTFFITDRKNYLTNGMLNAMSRARIPTEKVLAFADYIVEFVDIIMESGFSIPEGGFDPDKASENNIFNNFNYHFMQFFKKTGFTELEFGRFLYELSIDIAGESEYGNLLVELGRDDFVALTANTIYSYKMIMAATTASVEPSEARALQAIVYSLGSNYLKIINKLGFNGIEKLFGLSFDLDREYPNLTEDEFEVFKNVAEMLEGKAANLFYILGKSLTNTDAYTFEQLFTYFAYEDKDSLLAKESLIISHMELAKAIKSGIESSFVFKNTTKIESYESFITQYASLMTEYKKLLDIISKSEEEVDYDAHYSGAYEDLEYFIDCITALSAVESLQGKSAQELDILVDKAKGMWSIFDNTEELVDNTFSMMFANFLLKIINLQGFLENNRRAIADLISDSLAGLIDIRDLEGIIG